MKTRTKMSLPSKINGMDISNDDTKIAVACRNKKVYILKYDSG